MRRSSEDTRVTRRKRAATLAVGVLALLGAMACAPGGGVPSAARSPAGEAEPAQDAAQPWAFVYRCPDGSAFTARFDDSSVHITRELLSLSLPHAISASGARYSDEVRTYWGRGNEALLELPGDSVYDCVATPVESPWEAAQLLGYDFRAIGQEPGWMVAVAGGHRMHLLADYGEIQFFTGPPTVKPVDGGRVYRAEGNGEEVVLTVVDEPCQDIMSGEAFPARATLEFAGRRLEGCGRSTGADG